MIIEKENPDTKAGVNESAPTLSMQYKQDSICPCAGKTSTGGGCHFGKKEAARNERHVRAQHESRPPAKAPECNPTPAQKRCLTLLDYDKETGNLLSRVSRGGRRAGEVCGTDCHGYVQVAIDCKLYRAHRIIFKMVYGREPVGFIDHIDGDKSNNRLDNLREVLPWQNALNRIAPPTSNTGHLGVSWDKTRQKYVASIGVSGKVIKLGYYPNLCCAIAARKHAFDLVVSSPANDNGRAVK
ncbi:HNH endonuclease signature motif containing protein [Roseibium sp. MMSF_3544]|uniref:HNH endonuclease signature motif containing protein n=1 Tax=unclassified Roseibium TaxID=2629323 RepID=UPI00273D2AD3|nr:HNH endonuclease signature motif containing protein [Roseibium sp. MMSF_3544]